MTRSTISKDDARLVTLDELLLGHDISPHQWDAELLSGWTGSNGSSCSTDRLFWLIQTGRTTHEYSILPADQHDGYYRAIRRLLFCGQCTEGQAELARKIADLRFRNGILALVDDALSRWYARPLRTLGRERALIRYDAVRDFGHSSIRPRPADEGYPS